MGVTWDMLVLIVATVVLLTCLPTAVQADIPGNRTGSRLGAGD